jgi:stage V sporulation protein AE
MLLKMIFAFLVGGALCAVAQVMIDKTSLTPAKILVIFVCLGVLLGGVGLYDPIFNFAGCGISLPIVGFGGAVAKGVREAVDEFGLIGVLKGPISSMSAGVLFSLLLGFIVSLFFHSKPKDF